MDIFFFEAFKEEEKVIRHYLPSELYAYYTWQTIQEYGSELPPAPFISLRTQSEIPVSWAPSLKGILSRSTGYDHLLRYLKDIKHPLPC